MSIKTYASKYRNHKIVRLPGEMGGGPKGHMIEFTHGVYTTDNLAEQQAIEGSKWWRRAITLIREEPTPAELKAQRDAKKKAKAEAEAKAAAEAKADKKKAEDEKKGPTLEEILSS